MLNKLKQLENNKNKLEKKDIDLIITDFDDTIFCRKKQLKDSKILRENRWEKWNYAILNIIWLKTYIEKYYENEKYPNNITTKLRENHDLILTAWVLKIQEKKLKSTNLNNFNYRVVNHAEDKIFETANYIINTLGFIPNKVIIYEDRPNYFIENKELLENFLWTKLEINFVEMIDNNYEPIIKKI